MKKIALILVFLANIADAQIVVYQQHQIVSPYQGRIVANTCGPSCWAAKRYGPQYSDISQVPPEVRARVDNPPVTIITVIRPVIIPTVPAVQPLPGQSWEDHQRMQQMSR